MTNAFVCGGAYTLIPIPAAVIVQIYSKIIIIVVHVYIDVFISLLQDMHQPSQGMHHMATKDTSPRHLNMLQAQSLNNR